MGERAGVQQVSDGGVQFPIAASAGCPLPEPRRSVMYDQIAVVEDRAVKLSNPDKNLFPAAGLSKADLIDYYARIAPVILPHLAGRPLTFEGYPDGIASEGFMQKNASDYFPSWIPRARLAKQGGVVDHVLAEDAATLIYLANQACITFHVWLSRVDRIDYPDRIALAASSDAMLDKVRDGMAAGNTLRGEKKLMLGRAQGREFTVTQANGAVTAVRLYWARNRLYQLGVTGRAGVENQPETRHFFESFALVRS